MIQATFVVNGETQLVLTPGSEKEKALLAEFTGKSVKIESPTNVQILGKPYPDSIVITLDKQE